jgi:tetratricopeptide (TPR) repeat protein
MENENQSTSIALESIAQYIFNQFVKNDMPPPSGLESKEMRDARKKEEITEMLARNQIVAHEGALLLQKLDTDGSIKVIIDKIKKAKPADILMPNFFSDKDFELLMSKALDVYHDDQLIEAMNLFTFISQLFPKQVQPFIAMTTIIWKQSGPEEAADIYSQLIECLPNPLLMLYAADCFKAIDEKQKAKDTLEKGLKLCELNKSFDGVANDIRQALTQL